MVGEQSWWKIFKKMPFTGHKGTSLFTWRLRLPTHSHPPPHRQPVSTWAPFRKKLVSRENKTLSGGLTVSESQGHKSFFRMSLRKPSSGQIPQLPKKHCPTTFFSMLNFPRPLINSRQHIRSSRIENIPQTVSLKAVFKAFWPMMESLELGCGHIGGLLQSSTYISVQVLAVFLSVHFTSCCHTSHKTQFHQIHGALWEWKLRITALTDERQGMFNNQGPLWVSTNALFVLQEEPCPKALHSDSGAFLLLELMNTPWTPGMNWVFSNTPVTQFPSQDVIFKVLETHAIIEAAG